MRPSTVFVLLLVESCLFLSRSVFADDAVKPVEAKLIAKGDGYLVHIGVLNQSTAVIHTLTQTGKMQCLFASGNRFTPGPPVDGSYPAKSRLLGIVVSRGRIHLLTSHIPSGVMRRDILGRSQLPRPFPNGQCTLSAFSVSDGKELTSVKLKGYHPLSADVFDNGPLKVEGDKITVFKQSFRFDGKQFLPNK